MEFSQLDLKVARFFIEHPVHWHSETKVSMALDCDDVREPIIKLAYIGFIMNDKHGDYMLYYNPLVSLTIRLCMESAGCDAQ